LLFSHSVMSNSVTPTSNVKEAEIEQVYENLQDLLELTAKKMSFSA